MNPTEVAVLNANARRLLAHDAHVQFAGAMFTESSGDEELAGEFGSKQAYGRAIEWLVSKNLAEWVTADGFTITPFGTEVAADPDLLESELPAPSKCTSSSAQASGDVGQRVYDLNRDARSLLTYLHKWHLDGGGRPFYVGPCDETFSACSLDDESYRAAARRLIEKDLGKWAGGGGAMTITRQGVRSAEDHRLIEALLPVGAQSTPGQPLLQPDIASAIAEVRDVARDIIIDEALREIVERDSHELEAAVAHGLHKSAALLTGSIIEAVLLGVCERNRTIAATHMKQGKDFPEKATIEKLVEIARDEGLIRDLAGDVAATVREYRDLIHPDRERRTRPKVDDAMSGALLALLRVVVRDIRDAMADGRVEAYEAK